MIPFKFGSRVLIPESQIFLRSPNNSVAFVNISPVVPGHVLVCPGAPRRRRVEDMSDAEAADLMLTTRFVQKVVERLFGATSSTLVIQDGKDAGQTIDHGESIIA
jgi:diadenosine tetraphosphate (Ap4A) HIT family hydrolase